MVRKRTCLVTTGFPPMWGDGPRLSYAAVTLRAAEQADDPRPARSRYPIRAALASVTPRPPPGRRPYGDLADQRVRTDVQDRGAGQRIMPDLALPAAEDRETAQPD